MNKTECFVFYVPIVTKGYSWNDGLNVNYCIAALHIYFYHCGFCPWGFWLCWCSNYVHIFVAHQWCSLMKILTCCWWLARYKNISIYYENADSYSILCISELFSYFVTKARQFRLFTSHYQRYNWLLVVFSYIFKGETSVHFMEVKNGAPHLQPGIDAEDAFSSVVKFCVQCGRLFRMIWKISFLVREISIFHILCEVKLIWRPWCRLCEKLR
jgi:hypothetical protein